MSVAPSVWAAWPRFPLGPFSVPLTAPPPQRGSAGHPRGHSPSPLAVSCSSAPVSSSAHLRLTLESVPGAVTAGCTCLAHRTAPRLTRLWAHSEDSGNAAEPSPPANPRTREPKNPRTRARSPGQGASTRQTLRQHERLSCTSASCSLP